MDKNKTKKIDRLLKDILTHYDKKPGSKFKKLKEDIEKKEGINEFRLLCFYKDEYEKLSEEEKAEIQGKSNILILRFPTHERKDKDNVPEV